MSINYQNVPMDTTERILPAQERDEPIGRSQFKLMLLSGILGVLLLSMLIIGFSSAPVQTNAFRSDGSQSSSDILEAGDGAFLDGAALKSTFCKTSCNSPCSTVPSVYGELCCDWTKISTGDQVCAQSVSASGVCTCGVPEGSSVRPPVPVKAPTQKTTAAAPTPGFQPFGFQPFGFQPFGGGFQPFGFQPFGFTPISPIRVPDGATPCKSMCFNPCSSSEQNGVYTCCEATASGSCGTAQVDGKCYCY